MATKTRLAGVARALAGVLGALVVASTATPQAAEPNSPATPVVTAAPGVVAFGYNYFRPGAETISDGPVGAGYILSPGDEIVVSIWGAMVETFNLTVSDDGFVDLPSDGGRIHTNGVTKEELHPVILKHLSQIYASYIDATDPSKSTAFVDVRLGKVRKLLVYVLGEVNAPGAYQMSASMANVLNLLSNAGGVRESGSLREIKVRRGNGRVDTIDLYNLFLSGTVDSKALSLQPSDYVIVPLKKKSATIQGEVRRPANYELVADEGMRALVGFAGGFTPGASLSTVQIRRSTQTTGEMLIDVDLADLAKTDHADTPLHDDDKVLVRESVQVRPNTVTVTGDGVMRAGTYEWSPGMRLSNLVAKAGGLREHVYLTRADLIRTEDDFSKTLTSFSLEGVYRADESGAVTFVGSTENDLPLREMDEIIIQSAFGMSGKDKYVTLEGHAKEKGRFVLAKGMTLEDLIFAHGGFQDPAFRKATFLESAHITRQVPGTVGLKLITFNLGAVLLGDPIADVALEENDVVRLYSTAELASEQKVTISGVVKTPGSYPMAEGMTLEDLIVLAGGLAPDTYKAEAVIARQAISASADGSDVLVEESSAVVPVAAHFAVTPAERRTALKAFDRITVRNAKGWEPRETVSIQGEVVAPGYYTLKGRSETITSLIQRAGGLKDGALPEGAVLMRTDPSAGSLAATGGSKERVVTIDLAQALKSPGGAEDIVLNDGDEVLVPINPGTVEVRGAVRQPLTLQYRDGFGVEDYLAICGGCLDKADRGKLVVYGANNAVQIASGRDGTGLTITPGSVIEVPLIKESEWLETVQVDGAVAKPSRVQFVDGARLGFYLNFCGGFTQHADIDRVVVHLPDGTMVSKAAGEAFNPEIPAGSIIVVPAMPAAGAK